MERGGRVFHAITNNKPPIMTKLQKRVKSVLSQMIKQVEDCEDDTYVYALELDRVLDGLRDDDFFGTEGQCDPRGDGRNGTQSIL